MASFPRIESVRRQVLPRVMTGRYGDRVLNGVQPAPKRISALSRLVAWSILIDFAVAYIISPGTEVRVFGLLLPQLVRGCTLAIFTVIVLTNANHVRRRCRTSGTLYALGVIVLATISVAEYFRNRTLPLISINAYLQILYWLTFWVLIDLSATDRLNALYIVRRWLVAMFVLGGSVYYGYFTGSLQSYSDLGITASAGLAGYGKGLAGQMLVACVTILFFARRRHEVLAAIAAVVCVGSAFLTYVRSGAVAAAAAVAWLLIWTVFLRRGKIQGLWIARFLIVLAAAGVAFFALVGPGDLAKRWHDVSDSEKGGSGRAAFWRIAVDEYTGETLEKELAGIGYEGMLSLMERRYGIRIATHNDLLDALTVGGALGCLYGCLLAGLLVARWRSCPPHSAAFAVVGAILIVWLCQGLLTGQIFAPDTMVSYVLGITCVLAVSEGRRSTSFRADCGSRIGFCEPVAVTAEAVRLAEVRKMIRGEDSK